MSEELRSRWEAAGQGHVFQHWDSLTGAEQSSLLESLKVAGDPEALNSCFRSLNAEQPEEEGKQDEITPFRNLVHKELEEAPGSWFRSGLELLRKGSVAVVTLAGGQGTRLGSDEPKGCYDVRLPSGKSLFQLQAEKLLSLRALSASEGGLEEQQVPPIPWFIMTSEATHGPTVAFFEAHEHFGLAPGQLSFFQQGLMPAFDEQGRVLLQSSSQLALSPNGNGGVYPGLSDSGALKRMQEWGVEWVHVVGVDNVLVKPADPAFLGFASSAAGASIVNKVVMKTRPAEKVGVMCLRNGEPGVVEYSEITEEMSARLGEDGLLVFGAANIADHAFRLSFLLKCCSDEGALPWHKAVKKVPFWTPGKGHSDPESPNAVKVERFIFDVFRLDPHLAAFAVGRDEFSPVKNAEGEASPESARQDTSQLHKAWARALIPNLEFEGEGLFEVAPMVSYSQDLESQRESLRARLAQEQSFSLPKEISP